MNQESYVNVEQVAKRYGVSQATVWRWVRIKRMPAPIQFTKSCSRWPLSALLEWEESLAGNTKEAAHL